jgi:hypothetical protein
MAKSSGVPEVVEEERRGGVDDVEEAVSTKGSIRRHRSR